MRPWKFCSILILVLALGALGCGSSATSTVTLVISPAGQRHHKYDLAICLPGHWKYEYDRNLDRDLRYGYQCDGDQLRHD